MLELQEESIPSLLDEENVQEIPTIEITPDADRNEIDTVEEPQNEGEPVLRCINFICRKIHY